MNTKQLLEHVRNVVKGLESDYWLPTTINNVSNRINCFSDSEIEELELVYFELRWWIGNNIGHICLKDSLAKLEKSLYYSNRAQRIKGHVNIGAGYNRNNDHLHIKLNA